MLQLDGISAGYGSVKVLHEVSLEVFPGEVLCLLGRNGAGKTTTLKAIMGLVSVQAGTILLGADDICTLPPEERPKRGIGYIPQGRRLFAELTVAENIDIGLMARRKGRETRDKILRLFPRLLERLEQRADTLSGGEQQMLATARALALEPSVLLLDEPTEGLQPSMTKLIQDSVITMREQGVAIVLVEQRIDTVMAIADRVVFLENGYSRDVVNAETLRDDPSLLKKYLGV